MSLWNCKVLLSFNSYSTSAPKLMVSGNCSVAGKASNFTSLHCITQRTHTHKHTLKAGVDTYKAPPRKNTITSIDLELLDLHGYEMYITTPFPCVMMQFVSEYWFCVNIKHVYQPVHDYEADWEGKCLKSKKRGEMVWDLDWEWNISKTSKNSLQGKPPLTSLVKNAEQE